MYLQNVMFDITAFTINKCKDWLKKHNIIPSKPVHITKNYYRYRLLDPNINYKYKTIVLQKSPLIKGVVIL